MMPNPKQQPEDLSQFAVPYNHSSPHFQKRTLKRKRISVVSPYLAKTPVRAASTATRTHQCITTLFSPLQVSPTLSFNPYSLYDYADIPHHSTTSFSTHLRRCDIFRQRWDEYCASLLVVEGESEEQEQRFHHAVRHLCSKRCYFHAYLPYREWYSVCKEVHGSPKEQILVHEGWRCTLETTDANSTIAITFVNASSRTFRSKTRLLRYLEERSDGENTSARKALFRGVQNASTALTRRSTNKPPQSSYADFAAPYAPTESPYGLLEELFVNDDPWKLLMSAIFLNRTSRRLVDAILYEFFRSFPTVEAVLAESCVERIAFLIQPLGFYKRRAAGIISFSEAFVRLRQRKAFGDWTSDDIKGLYHCGQYASDVYRLFYHCDWGNMTSACDHALNMYLTYQRERAEHAHFKHNDL